MARASSVRVNNTVLRLPASMEAGRDFSMAISPKDMYGNEITAAGLELTPSLSCSDASRSWTAPAALVYDAASGSYRLQTRVETTATCDVVIRSGRGALAKEVFRKQQVQIKAISCAGPVLAVNAGGDRCVCARGYVKDGVSCGACALGRYKEAEGDIDTCLKCAETRTTARVAVASRAECLCEDGYFDPLTYNVTCEHEHKTQVECAFENVGEDGMCVKCPSCALCSLDRATGKTSIMPRSGYWQHNASAQDIHLYKCAFKGCNCNSTGCTQSCELGPSFSPFLY